MNKRGVEKRKKDVLYCMQRYLSIKKISMFDAR